MKNLIILSVGLMILLNSCATLFSGTKSQIFFDSNIDKATISVDGIKLGITPQSIQIKKKFLKKSVITLNADGFEKQNIQLKRKFDVFSILNLLSPVGWAIDILTGAVLNFSNKEYFVEFKYGKSGIVIDGIKIDELELFDLPEMVNVFIRDCKVNGITLRKNKISATSVTSLSDGVIALAKGMNNDSEIIIEFDAAEWKKASPSKKWYILYHELGHDVLNLKHGNGGKMMFNYSESDYSWNQFKEGKNYMFKSYKKTIK